MCELFDKADTGGDGTISLEEYMVMCDEYGIELNDEHLRDVRSIANDNGEVKSVLFFTDVRTLIKFPISGSEK